MVASGRLAALSPAGHHAHLEGQQLVMREPSDGRVSLGEIVGQVGRFDRGADRGLVGHHIGRQVFGVGTEAVERGADGGPERP